MLKVKHYCDCCKKELNRDFIGSEIDESYFEICEKRLESKAVDRVNGLTVQDRKYKEKGIQNIFDYL